MENDDDLYSLCTSKTAKEVKSPWIFDFFGMVYDFIVINGFNLISWTVSSS
jgi:hypothetical protein